MAMRDKRDSAAEGNGWQAQKSASTRNLIVEAAIRCFVDLGYARTTTTRIAAKAGLSRGAMLHHFPSKIDIVRAAVEQLHDMRLDDFRRSIDSIPAGADRLKTAVSVCWDHFNAPLFVASFELTVAARTDPELEKIMRPAQAAFDERWFQTARELFPAWQGDQEAFELALTLMRRQMEGMAVSFMSPMETGRQRRVLEHLERCLRDLGPGQA